MALHIEFLAVAALSWALCTAIVYRRRLQDVEVRLDLLGSAMPDVALWLDRTQRIRHTTGSAADAFKIVGHELKGMRVRSLLPDLDCRVCAQSLRLRSRRRPVQTSAWIDTVATTGDGVEFPVLVRVALCGPGCRYTYLLIVRDVTQQRFVEQEQRRHAEQLMVTKQALERQNASLEETIAARTAELRLAIEAAESANASKSEFFANVSHELRTPLHGILSFASFGSRRIHTASTDKLYGYFQNIEQCGQTLLHLVNQLLDLAKLESRNTTLNLQRHDLAQLVGQVVAECAAMAEQQGIKIVIDNADEPLDVLVDGDRIGQVVRNLLGNALKFSPRHGRIEIDMTTLADVITVSVIDEGPGIPEAELDAVFEKFVQSSQTKTGAGGTGLGLAICRETISSHGGRIWAENVKPHGAAFVFELPRQQCDTSGREMLTTHQAAATC